MENPSAFGPGAAGSVSITPTDPGLPQSELPRLSRQATAILCALLARPRWNYELATIGLCYTRRLSDIRAAGFAVDIIAKNDEGARLYGITVWKHMGDGSFAHAVICEPADACVFLTLAPGRAFISRRLADAEGWQS